MFRFRSADAGEGGDAECFRGAEAQAAPPLVSNGGANGASSFAGARSRSHNFLTMAEQSKPAPSLSDIFTKASKKALSGGLAGMGAQAINVLTLMWMRTIMNYQYRYGGTFMEVTKKLYAEGGIPRFYRGLAPGLIQASDASWCETDSDNESHTTVVLALSN
eukprot:Skav236646  [mRNA]  locus=scaffold691:45884:52245:+ [translate_table: standard]